MHELINHEFNQACRNLPFREVINIEPKKKEIEIENYPIPTATSTRPSNVF